MLTLLSFEEEKKRKLLPFPLIKGNVTVAYEEAGGITARKISCKVKNGRINSDKLIKKLGKDRQVVCNPQRKKLLPPGVRSFSERGLRERLCGNFAVSVAQRLGEENRDLKIGLFDPEGKNSDLPAFFLECTRNLLVVTYETELYSQCAQWILNEKGALFSVSSDIGDLADCALIVALEPIREKIYPSEKSIILTSEMPCVPLGCSSFWEYSVDVPEKYKKLCPKDIPEIIFCEALYSKCGIYDLGSQIPLLCRNNSISHTALSLGKYLGNLVKVN